MLSKASYFAGDCNPAGRTVQNAVVGVVKEQKQPLAQGWVKLHLPLQVVDPLAPVRNCWAETVPKQRTAVIMAASNMFLIFLVITTPYLLN
ncbi:MAG TPA: hypothetical protein VH724_00480 [Candidatus Angelobacter sp.]|nr:hypothetical protein [Candidatus Angelobacter sp.]